MPYYTETADGTIIAYSDEKFSEYAKFTEKEIVYGYDGKLYFSDETPKIPDEEKYYAERAAVDAKYSTPWNGLTGGILTVLQMTMTAALCEVPQNPEKIMSIGTEYQAELAAMRAELQAIDEKYGV